MAIPLVTIVFIRINQVTRFITLFKMKTLSFDPLIKFVCQNVPADRYPDANICEHMRLLFAAVACVKIHILHTLFKLQTKHKLHARVTV